MSYMRQWKIKTEKFLEDTDKKTGILAGTLAVTTLFAVLMTIVQNWYNKGPVYKELICGLTTWSGYNKQADMQVIKTILLGLPVLFLCFFLLIQLWKHFMQYRVKSGIILTVSYLGVLCLFYISHPMKWQYLLLWGSVTIGYLICNCGTSSKYEGNIFKSAVLVTLFFQLTGNALLLFANSLKVRVSTVWETVGSYFMIVVLIFFFSVCILGRIGKLLDSLYLLQILMPISFAGMVHFRYLYELDDSTIELFYSGRWKWFCYLICIGLFILCVLEIKMRKKNKQRIFLSTFIVTAVLRVYALPQGILSIDYFHNGELSLPMQQLMSYGKMPYRDLIPIHGMCDYFYGLVNYVFFDGSYLSLNAAKIIGNLAMAVILSIVVYYFVSNKMQGLFLIYLFMPFMINTAGIRYFLLFILFFILFSPKMRNGIWYLYSWTLLSIVAIAWNASIGGAGALAFLPVVLYRSIKFIPSELFSIFTEKDKIKKKVCIVVAWLVLLIIGILFIPIFLQIVNYLKDNTGTTLYVNGMEMLKQSWNAASYLVPGLVNEQKGFFLIAFGFFIPVLVCLYYSLKKGPNYARGYLITLLLCLYVIINYAFVRFDEGLRSRVIGVFFLILIAITLLYEQMKVESEENKDHIALIMYIAFVFFAICLTDDSPMLNKETLSLRQSIPESIETEIGAKQVSDPVVYVTGDSVSMPKLGTGFIQANMLNSLQKRQKVIEDCKKEGKTILDITNAVATNVIFDIPSYLPYTSAYNISNDTMQDKAISLLKEKLPDVIIAAPEIRFDDAPFSFRSIKLYRFLMQQEYKAYKYENVIFLVRGDNPVKEAEINEEAFAQLMHKGYLGQLPAVWGSEQNLNYLQQNENLSEVDINYQLKETEEGITVNFLEPIDSGRVFMLGLNIENKAEDISALTVDVQNNKDVVNTTDNIEMQLKWDSQISAEGNATYIFLVNGEHYLIPVYCSPYFTNEKNIEHMELNFDKEKLPIKLENIVFKFYSMD